MRHRYDGMHIRSVIDAGPLIVGVQLVEHSAGRPAHSSSLQKRSPALEGKEGALGRTLSTSIPLKGGAPSQRRFYTRGGESLKEDIVRPVAAECALLNATL